MMTMSKAATLATVAAFWGLEVDAGTLANRQPAYTITSVPSRDASFLQQQVRLAWGKPYVDAKQHVEGNHIYFLTPQKEAVTPRLDGDGDIPEGQPPMIDDADDSTKTTPTPVSDVDDDIIMLQQKSSARTARIERLAKKRGGVHDQRAAFAPKRTTVSKPIVPSMVETKPARRSQNRKGSFVQMANAAKAATNAATTERQRAEIAARHRAAATHKAMKKPNHRKPAKVDESAAVKAKLARFKASNGHQAVANREAMAQRFARDMGKESVEPAAMAQVSAQKVARQRAALAKHTARSKLQLSRPSAAVRASGRAAGGKKASAVKHASKLHVRAVQPQPSGAGLLQKKVTRLAPIHAHSHSASAFVQKHFGIRNKHAAKVQHIQRTPAPAPTSRHSAKSTSSMSETHASRARTTRAASRH